MPPRPQQLLSQDVLLAVRLLDPPPTWTFESIGKAIGISASQCHSAFHRLCASGLVDKQLKLPVRAHLLEFLTHGVRYVFPAEEGLPVRGIPTAHSAPIWRKRLSGPIDSTLVWPHPGGKAKGTRVEPLYKTVPMASLLHEPTYAIMAVIDSLRLGKARERSEATALLKELIYGG